MIKHAIETDWSITTVEEIKYTDPAGVEALRMNVPYAGHVSQYDGKLLDAYDVTFPLELEEVEFLHRVFGEWLQHQRGKQ